MTPPQKYRLLDNVINGRNKIIAKRNDVVEFIADHQNVLIVSDKPGERFTIQKEKALKIT